MSDRARKLFEEAMERRMNPKEYNSIQQTIELDCAPGGIRPGDLIANVIKDTGLPLRDPVAKCFGNWTWDYGDIEEPVFKAAKPLLKERIEALYRSGRIRYGSW